MESVSVKNMTKNGAHVSVDLEVGTLDMEPFFMNILEKLKKQVKIKGFRPGKAPSQLVEQKFGERADAIFMDDFLPMVIYWYNQKNQLNTLENPKVDVKEYVRKQKLLFTADYDIVPQVTLPGYKKMSIKEDVLSIEDEDLEKELKSIQNKHAELRLNEFSADNGDEITLLAAVSDEKGVVLEENKIIKTILGENKHLPDLDKGLQNIKRDEHREFKIKYPKDFHDINLRGRTLDFKCTAKEINEVILPNLDDELAKDEGFNSLDDLKNHIKSYLENIGKNIIGKRTREKMIEKLTEQAKTDIPNSILEEEIHSLIKELVKQRSLKSANLDDLEKEIGGKEGKKIADEIRKQATLNTKRLLMLIEIAKTEEISVTREELDMKVLQISKQFGMEKDELMDRLRKNNTLYNISQDLLIQKTIDFIYRQSDKKKGKSLKFPDLM